MIHKLSTDNLTQSKPSPQGFLELPKNPISLILHNIRSLQNVGLIFRVADAYLIEKVYLTGFTGYPPLLQNDPRPPHIQAHALNEIQKTCINLLPFIPWEYQEDPIPLLKKLKKINYQIISVEQTKESANFTQPKYKFPLVLIFGHERLGVDELLLDLSDLVIQIPMLGMGNSHNVAMSAGIVLSEIVSHHLPQ